MYHGAIKERWERLSNLESLIANCNRDPKQRKQPYEPKDFNCYRPAAKPKPAIVASKKNGNWNLVKEAAKGAGWFRQPSNSTPKH